MKKWETYLDSIYFDPAHPGSFAGPEKLHRVVKKEGQFDIGQHRIQQWLQNQEAYSLQKPVKRRFKRNRVIADSIDEQWDADLMDMGAYAKANNNTKFVLVAIDIFSRYLWLEPLPSKKARDVVEGFKRIFAKGRKPIRLRTDPGGEFANKLLHKYLKPLGVHHFVTHNEVKANYAERVIKTVKSKIVRYFTHTQSHRYLPILQDVADSYNATFHRSLGRAPKDVKLSNETEVLVDQYFIRNPKPPSKKRKKKSSFRFKVGDFVRVTHNRQAFTREYDETWTGEVFKIGSRFLRDDLPIYRLRDYYGQEDIVGTFYESELQKVQMKEDALWKVEKVLRQRTKKGVGKEYLVRWMHWPKKYDSWVKASSVKNIQKK
jgi:hypothetical protein